MLVAGDVVCGALVVGTVVLVGAAVVGVVELEPEDELPYVFSPLAVK